MATRPTLRDQASPLAVDLRSIQLTDAQFERLCRDNPELRLELTARGELMVMPPTGSETGRRNAELTYQLTRWAKEDGRGVAFDSSTGFALPNRAKRSPDASWVRSERWEALTEDEKTALAPLCPDFVAEIRSSDDSFAALRAKMEEYVENGARLGWLLDPLEKRVYVYRPGKPVESLEKPEQLGGGEVLQGFVLDLAGIL